MPKATIHSHNLKKKKKKWSKYKWSLRKQSNSCNFHSPRDSVKAPSGHCLQHIPFLGRKGKGKGGERAELKVGPPLGYLEIPSLHRSLSPHPGPPQEQCAALRLCLPGGGNPDLLPLCISLHLPSRKHLCLKGWWRDAQKEMPRNASSKPVRGHPSPALDLPLVAPRPSLPSKPRVSCRVLCGPRAFLGPSPAPLYQLSNLPKHRHTAARDENCTLIDETLGKITWF